MINNNIYLKINNLEKKINKIDDKLNELISLMNENKQDCEKMSIHIDFINSIYEQMKAPIDFICNKFKLISDYTALLKN